jgi:hypothetical protein
MRRCVFRYNMKNKTEETEIQTGEWQCRQKSTLG